MYVLDEPMVEFDHTDIAVAVLGESPAVDEATGHVWWVDTVGKRLFRTGTRDAETGFWDLPEEIGFVVLDKSGLPVIGLETGLFVLDPQTGELHKLLDQTRDGHRFNDAAVDAQGRLWASTMSLTAARGEGTIWRIAEDLALAPVIEGLTIPNGIAIDTLRSRLYYSDSHPDVQAIWTVGLDPDGAQMGAPALFADMKSRAGRPDGAALDAEGRYWIAAVDGAALRVYSPEAEHLFDVPLPVTFPTKLAFHGDDCSQLVVTSKQDGKDGGRLAFLSFKQGSMKGVQQARWNRPSTPDLA